MAKVGDRIKVNFRGVVLSGTIDSTKAPVSMSGKIVEDLGHSWLVQLDVAVEDKNQIVMPKEAEARNAHP